MLQIHVLQIHVVQIHVVQIHVLQIQSSPYFTNPIHVLQIETITMPSAQTLPNNLDLEM